MNTIAIILITILNAVAPGAGFFFIKRYRSGIILLLLLVTTSFCFILSRQIFSEAGFKFFVFSIASIHLLSTVRLVQLFAREKVGLYLGSFISSIVFFLCGIGIFFSFFIYKDHALGIQIYFIPSISMKPTLEPGDFILVDSWSYAKNTPQAGDIIVFTTPAINGTIVKRVQEWPTNQFYSNKLYVMGDNRLESQDSRKFGGISPSQVKGEVKLVLFSINEDLSIKPNRIVLKPIDLSSVDFH